MKRNKFGKTAMLVSSFGFGAGHLDKAFQRDSIDGVEKIIDGIYDLGINLIDTAGCYGQSEELIGKCLKGKRHSFIISSKTGHGIAVERDWSFSSVTKGVDRSLQRLKTDYIDIMHLHSCSLQVLQEGEVIAALEQCKQAGKVRAIAFSGENTELKYAIELDKFDAIMASNSFLDQSSNLFLFSVAKQKELGIIGKRPLANCVWSFASMPERADLEIYWQRLQSLKKVTNRALNLDSLVYGYLKYGSPMVDSHIFGSSSLRNITHNLHRLRIVTQDNYLLDTAKQLAIAENWGGVV